MTARRRSERSPSVEDEVSELIHDGLDDNMKLQQCDDRRQRPHEFEKADTMHKEF